MDKDVEKVDLNALRRKFEKDASAKQVEKRQTVFEVSKSHFDGGGRTGVGNIDGQRLNKAAAPVSLRRSSEADLKSTKPVISPKPPVLPKKPVIGTARANLPEQNKGQGVVGKHAKRFEQSSPYKDQLEGHNVVTKVSEKPDVKDKPVVSPRKPILPSFNITSLEQGDVPQDVDISVQSKKKLFEHGERKPNVLSRSNIGDKEVSVIPSGSVLNKFKVPGSCDQTKPLVSPITSPESRENGASIAPKHVPPPPPKPTRTFAHDIYREGQMQRISAGSVSETIEENPEEKVFGMVDFRTRGVIVGEEDRFIPTGMTDMRERLATDLSQSSLDSSFHDYEDVESPTNVFPPQSPASRPALPLPSKGKPATPRLPITKKFISSDDYCTLENFRVKSGLSGASSTKSNKSQLSQRSNSDECLYSRTYEISTPMEYCDPVDLFSKVPRRGIPGFPNVEVDDYGYAVPQHTQLKTPLCMSRSLDGHTRFHPPTAKPPGVPKDVKEGLKRQKVITSRKGKSSHQKSDDWENLPAFIKKDDHVTKSHLDYVKTYRRKAVIRQKIGQAFSILRHNVLGDVDDNDVLDVKEDDRQSNDSESQIDLKELQRRIRHVTSIKEKNRSIYERVRAFRERIYPQLFEYAAIIGLEMVNGKCQPVVLHKFPHHVDPEKTSIPEFCFPDKDVLMPVTKYDSESFSFVLTSSDGRRDYGYCKRLLPPGRGARLPEVICIVSPLGAHTLYSQVLDHAEKRRLVSSDYAMELIAATYGKPLPSLGRSIDVNSMNTQGTLETLTLSRQEDARMENVNFEYLFSCLGIENVLQVFSAILLERRMLFSASKLSTLSNCIHALVGLLYPFQWQHTFIPVLPAALLDITCAPTPYIIGIMSPNLPKIDDLPTEEVLIIDLDKACLLRTCDDETTIIPRKLQKALIEALKMAMEDSDGQKNVLISEAFVRLFVESVGHFEEHVGIQQDGEKVFQKDSFCKAVSSKSLRMFLEWFCETQMFHSFINDHLDGTCNEKGLFDARIAEYKQELASMPPTSWNNFREKLRNIGKAIKTNIKGSGDQKKKAV